MSFDWLAGCHVRGNGSSGPSASRDRAFGRAFAMSFCAIRMVDAVAVAKARRMAPG